MSLLRRLHSVAGVFALGAFFALHIAHNAAALYGRAAYVRAWARVTSLPWWGVLELALVAVPLVFHVLVGFWFALRGAALGHGGRGSALIQRVSGFVALLFVCVHLWHFRLARLRGLVHWRDYYYWLALLLDEGAMFAFYLVGVSAAALHFAHGLWRAGGTWGLTTSPRARRRSAWACGVFGALLWLVAVDTLLHFAARCGGVLPLPGRSFGEICRAAEP